MKKFYSVFALIFILVSNIALGSTKILCGDPDGASNVIDFEKRDFFYTSPERDVAYFVKGGRWAGTADSIIDSTCSDSWQPDTTTATVISSCQDKEENHIYFSITIDIRHGIGNYAFQKVTKAGQVPEFSSFILGRCFYAN